MLPLQLKQVVLFLQAFGAIFRPDFDKDLSFEPFARVSLPREHRPQAVDEREFSDGQNIC
jgi:hypothetical protein